MCLSNKHACLDDEREPFNYHVVEIYLPCCHRRRILVGRLRYYNNNMQIVVENVYWYIVVYDDEEMLTLLPTDSPFDIANRNGRASNIYIFIIIFGRYMYFYVIKTHWA